MLPLYINGKFTVQRTTGVQRVAHELVRTLDDACQGTGNRPVLLCPPGAPSLPLSHIEVRTLGQAGLPLHAWEQALLPQAARSGLLLSLAGSAPFAAARQACVIHDAAVFDHPEAYRLGFVVWYRALFRRLARTAAALVTVSAFSQGRLAERLGVARSRLSVIPNGSDHLHRVTADDGVLDRLDLVGRRFLLAVASDNPTKNLPALIAAFARRVARDDVRLVLVGGRAPHVFAGSTRRAPADPPGLLRAGPLDDASLVALYRHADALVMPSLYEGSGLPALEAMAAGCPVVASSAAALPETCGDAAVYVDPHSVDAISAGLVRVLHDAPLRARLRAAGQARAKAMRWRDGAALLQAAIEPHRAPGARLRPASAAAA